MLQIDLPRKNLLAHAESNCRRRSKHLQIQVIDYQLYNIVLEMRKLCRGTPRGQKLAKICK